MNVPLFSVIIPTYNREKFLKKAINSVLLQTVNNFELIIIDDGSTDQTKDLIRSIADHRLKYVFQKHKGVSSARNKGVQTAQGEFIFFLDSDDWFKPNKLEITFNYIKRYPDYKIFHTEETWYRNQELLNQKKVHRKPTGYVFKKALKICCISISTAAIKKDVFQEIGMFDENLNACEDYDFWLRATAKYKVKLIPEFLTEKEGGHADQLSKKYEAMDVFRIYAIKKILTSNTLNTKQTFQAIKELQRRCLIYIKGAEKRKKITEVKYYKNLINNFKLPKQESYNY